MKTIHLHFRSFFSALKKIVSSPFEHLLNILTLAVIITVLCTVLAFNKNLSYLQKTSMTFPQIIIYLKDSAAQQDVSAVEAAINKFNTKIIKNYQFISKDEGLKELQQDENLKQIASDVINNNNPLPDTLVINTNTADNHKLQMLVEKIGKLPQVDDVQMDNKYAGKIANLLDFVNQVAHILQAACVVVLVIVVYNIIRLQMLLRQDEIIVSRLIGASDSFIMRPLSYYAILQIALATGLAIFTVNLFIQYINSLFSNLTSLFGSSVLLTQFNLIQILQIGGLLVIFGVFAVFLAVRWVFRNSYIA